MSLSADLVAVWFSIFLMGIWENWQRERMQRFMISTIAKTNNELNATLQFSLKQKRIGKVL